MREQQILGAAKRLFFERGYDAVSVDQIGTAAGTVGPRIYAHFEGKGEILATLFDAALDRLLTLSGDPDEAGSPQERLRHLAAAHARFALADRELLSIYAREERALPPAHRRRLRRRQRQYVERWVDVLAELNPDWPEADVRAVAYALIGLVISTAQWPDDVFGHADLEPLIVGLVLRAAAPT